MIPTSFILMALSALSLPLLSILALLLRRNLFQGKWKLIFLTLGLALLVFAVINTFQEVGSNLSLKDVFAGGITAAITLFILSKFNHGHTHSKEVGGVKGIIISESFHSLIDGAVIGATYLINPILGYAATIGIIIHELPKILGTLTVLRSFGLSVQRTIYYGILAQIGSPVAALFIYLLGKQVSEEQFQILEIASVSSLGAIVLWILYLEINFHIHHKNSIEEKHDH